MRRLKASGVRPASALLHCCLSVTVVLAFAKLSATLGLEYHVSYSILPVDLIVISTYTDLFIWFWGTVAIVALAFIVALGMRNKERFTYLFLSAATVLPIAVYLNQQPLVAYWASLILQVSFMALTTIFARRFRLRTQLEGMVTPLGILIMLTVVESASLFRNVQRIWNPSLPLIDLQAQLSGLAFNFSVPLMLVALFSWLATIPLVVRNLRRGSIQEAAKAPERNTRFFSALLLLVAVLVSLVVALSPYASGSMLRGVDTRTYYNELSSIQSLANSVALIRFDYKALVLLPFYIMEVITGWSPYFVIIAGPAVLAALLVIVSYLLVLGVTRDWLAAGFSGILAAASFQVTVGLFAGIFANFLAVSFVAVMFYLLSTPLSKFRATLMILASYAVLLAHVWTWAIAMGSVGVSAILVGLLWLADRKASALRNSVAAHSLLMLCGFLPVMTAYLASYLNLFSPGIASSLTNLLTNALQSEGGSVNSSHLGTIIMSLLWLSATMIRYVGAIFAYPLTLFLTILGLIFLAKTNVRAVGPFVGLSVVTSVSMLLLTSEYQWRLLYLIPFQALAALGMIALLRAVEWVAARSGIDPTTRSVRLCEALLAAVILIDSVNYALGVTYFLPVS